ncbi:MAG: hypothetical protein ACYC1C_05915 [Chloroflexota bacterium]
MIGRLFGLLLQKRFATIAAGLAMVLVLSLTACSASTPTAAGAGQSVPTAGAATQSNSSGQVTVEATWQDPAAGPVFDLAMNTHSVNLDGLDLTQLAVLRTDQGREVQAQAWDAPKGGHHRRGKLVFAANLPDGSPLIGPETREVDLIIRDVAGVPERVFKWLL